MAKNRQRANPLDNLQDAWGESTARQFGQNLAVGIYVGVIEQAVVGRAKPQDDGTPGRMQCTWDLQVTEGECQGRQTKKFSGLETKDNLDWFKGDLEILEVEIPDDIVDLGDALSEIAGTLIRFSVRQNGEFTNIDFIEPLEGDYEADDPEDPEATEPDDPEDPEDETPTLAQLKKMKAPKLLKLLEAANYDIDDFEDDVEFMRDTLIEEYDLA